jgi:GNAT superfamily N-acetyltransferase
MRAREFVTEAKTVDYEGLTLKVSKNDHELMVDALDDWGNKVLGHVKFNIGDGQELDPQDLRVDDKYQGQGIARVMYDYVKSLGYTINRSWDQTDAGAGFWNKHRGEDVRVWEQGVAEGSLNESAVFLNPDTVVVGQEHGQPLELSPDTLKKVQAIAAKHGAWYEGNGTDRSYTKGQIDRYAGSWDDEVAKTASPNDPKWLYVLFANVDENNRVKRVGVDPKDTIFNRLMDSAQDNSFQGIGFTALALKKFLSMASEGKYDFVKMSQQPATQENLTRFLKAGEDLMWPSNWEQYPNKAGKIAKAATVDVRDQYLATRKAGVYVTGGGHLKAVQNITGKQGVAEDWKDAAATAAMFIPPLAPYAKAYNIGKNLYQVGKAVSDYKKASDELNAMEPEFAAQRERQTAQNSKFYSLNDVDKPVQSMHDDPNIEKIDELNFLGSECTKDCSGHRAGYAWSKRKGLQQANSWSPSFNKGAGLAVAGK